MDTNNMKVGRLLSPEETAGRLGVSLKTLKRLEAKGELPSRTQISERRYGWREPLIDQFIIQRST